MDTRDVLSFIKRSWGIFSAGTSVFFPYFDQVTNIVYVPAVEGDKTDLLTWNSVICAFAVLFFFLIQTRRKNLAIPALLFMAGVGMYLLYKQLIFPIETLHQLGISADVSYLTGYPEIVYRVLYWAIFGSITGSFSSLIALFYQPNSSRYSW